MCVCVCVCVRVCERTHMCIWLGLKMGQGECQGCPIQCRNQARAPASVTTSEEAGPWRRILEAQRGEKTLGCQSPCLSLGERNLAHDPYHHWSLSQNDPN